MRTVVALVVAAALGFLLFGPASAAPPEDIAGYCRASYPQVSLLVRCFNVEQAAAQRVISTASAVDSALFSRCLGGSQSWTSMESCLTQLPRAPAGAGAPAEAGAPSAEEPGPQPEQVAAAAEPERPTRLISEADAERQLRGVLERVGRPTARCTKKQYGPGWASICE